MSSIFLKSNDIWLFTCVLFKILHWKRLIKWWVDHYWATMILLYSILLLELVVVERVCSQLVLLLLLASSTTTVYCCNMIKYLQSRDKIFIYHGSTQSNMKRVHVVPWPKWIDPIGTIIDNRYRLTLLKLIHGYVSTYVSKCMFVCPPYPWSIRSIKHIARRKYDKIARPVSFGEL